MMIVLNLLYCLILCHGPHLARATELGLAIEQIIESVEKFQITSQSTCNLIVDSVTMSILGKVEMRPVMVVERTLLYTNGRC